MRFPQYATISHEPGHNPELYLSCSRCKQTIPDYIYEQGIMHRQPGLFVFDILLTINRRPDGSLTVTKVERVNRFGVELIASM